MGYICGLTFRVRLIQGQKTENLIHLNHVLELGGVLYEMLLQILS